MNEYSQTGQQPIPDMESVLGLVRTLVGELNPKWKNLHFLPDTQLEHELGLDSMARAELCSRIESSLGIRLDERKVIGAATVNELYRAIVAQARGGEPNTNNTVDDTTTTNSASDLLMGSFGAANDAAAIEQRHRHTLADWLYAFYAWPVFIVLGLLTWLAVVLAPFENWRQRLAKTGARMLFRCTFTPFEVDGLEHIDSNTSAIIVANHASYLDGFIITAALNIPVHFIVKGELAGVWPARVLLQRFGVEFVERFSANRGSGDITRIVKKSRSGQSMVFFPEGTFITFPGLQPFRMGAFVTAARSGVAVIPVAISGSRGIQSGSDFFPHRGHIRVTVCKALLPQAANWQAAVQLRDAARREIAQHCEEIDLLDARAGASGNQ